MLPFFLGKNHWPKMAILAVVVTTIGVANLSTIFGQIPNATQPAKPISPFDAGEKIDALITDWVLDAIPHSFNDEKKWGKQEEMHTQIRFRKDPGGKIETYREKKMVNHGDWSKYSAHLLNPNEEFKVQLKNIRSGGDGEMLFDIHFLADLAIEGRQANWVRGVQLYSVGAEGTAQVELIVACSLKTGLDFNRLPPDLVLTPSVESADINVVEFRLNHVGKFGGEVAQQVTNAARRILDDKVAEREIKLAEKLNQKIDENRGKLRISTAKAASLNWTEQARPHLPPQIQQTLSEQKKQK